MPRTTSDAVAAIVEIDSDIDLSPFIETANAIVTDICAPLGYDDTRLELIERWLSAHFYRIRDQAIASEAAGSVSETFQYKIALDLKQTQYGQQAIALDTKGGLAAFNKRLELGTPKPGITWLGSCNPGGSAGRSYGWWPY